MHTNKFQETYDNLNPYDTDRHQHKLAKIEDLRENMVSKLRKKIYDDADNLGDMAFDAFYKYLAEGITEDELLAFKQVLALAMKDGIGKTPNRKDSFTRTVEAAIDYVAMEEAKELIPFDYYD